MRCSHDCSAWIGGIEAGFDWRAVLEWCSLVHTSLIFPIEFMKSKTNLHVRRRICGLRSVCFFCNIPRILLNSIKCISKSLFGTFCSPPAPALWAPSTAEQPLPKSCKANV